MTFVEFFGGSYFLAWCALWLGWVVVPIVGFIVNFVLKISSRCLRSINILFHGWPPDHLDADGDPIQPHHRQIIPNPPSEDNINWEI